MPFWKKKETRKHANGELHLGQPTEKPEKKPFEYHGKWTKLHQILHDNRGVRYFVAAVFIIIATGLGLLAMLATYEDPVVYDLPLVTKKKPAPTKFYSPLTGNEVSDKATTEREVTAIMIENSPDARPQSGLKESGIVFEAIAEGGITRFLVLYQEQQPELIGPVRSVRPYYIDWAAPFDASIAHVGGSYNALQEVRNGQYKDIDQFFNAGAYWRASDRYAPHNVYTSFKRLNELNAQKEYTKSTFTGFPRTPIETSKKKKTEKDTNLTPATAVQVPISSSLYNSSYTYDKNTKTYLRDEAGEPHTDREAGQIAPRVVIVLKVPTSLGFEDGYREQMQTIGSGEGYLFQNGTVQPMTWKKADKKSQIRFVDAHDKDILLERGQTWITAIGTDRTPTWQ